MVVQTGALRIISAAAPARPVLRKRRNVTYRSIADIRDQRQRHSVASGRLPFGSPSVHADATNNRDPEDATVENFMGLDGDGLGLVGHPCFESA